MGLSYVGQKQTGQTMRQNLLQLLQNNGVSPAVIQGYVSVS